MGNAITLSCLTSDQESFVKVVYWEGNTKTLKGKRWLAGEIMFDYPESMVCDADCFFIGHPIPFLTIGDHLKPGKTYFVLPLDIFSSKTVSASSVSALIASMPKRTQFNFKECPFEYINASNGRVLIKLSTEFMAKILTIRKENHDDQENGSTNGNSSNGSLCSTPELKKHYEQLVGSKEQQWSPNLKTILEHNYKFRYSPYRLIMGLEWKKKEGISVC
uniref:uncharacterized protein LOC122604270 n=1 Tax=Erigeron canadensis TaxID=72917 RepID=UPI001CB9A797|nr:uncharacterized protein LOC122604270 [Erigeron canadensis]